MLVLNRHKIAANIQDRYANIVYLFDFENVNASGSDELKFEITIDPNAFISNFIAIIDGEIFEGITKEKLTAAKEYNTAKKKNENAILISQPHKNIPNVFQIKTNIDAKSKISLNITIEQYLQKQFNYNILNIQILRNFNKYNIKPNYKYIELEIEISDTSGIYDIQIPNSSLIVESSKYVEESNNMCDSVIIDHKIIDESCQNCKIIGKMLDEASCINELIIKYKIKGEEEESYVLFDNKTNTFCQIISDIFIANENKNRENILIPRRVIFVIDRSGSMGGEKWNKTVESTIIALQKLRKGFDKYCVLLFDDKIELLPNDKYYQLSYANNQNIYDSINLLKTKKPRNSTDINKALLTGIELIKSDINENNTDDLFMNQIIFITDGEPNTGIRDTKQILQNVKKVNDKKLSIGIFSFGVGSNKNDSQWIKDLNHSFLKSLSLNNYGFYKRIKTKTANIELNDYLNILSKPIAANIKVEYDNNNNITDLTNMSFNTLYSGNDIIICGKINGKIINDLNVTICGITNIKTTENKLRKMNICKKVSVNIDNTTNNSNVERIWAYLKLKQFAKQELIHNDMIEIDDDEKKENESLPLSLALKYKFITPWTSMIVVKQKTTNEAEQKQSEPEHKLQTPNFTTDELASLRASFQFFDNDGNGSVDQQEISEVIQNLGVNLSADEVIDIMAGMDENGDGVMDYNEFMTLMDRRMDINSQRTEMEETFKVFDTNKDGKISFDDLKETLNALGEQVTDKDVMDMMKEADLNGDGFIDFEEFVIMMTANEDEMTKTLLLDNNNKNDELESCSVFDMVYLINSVLIKNALSELWPYKVKIAKYFVEKQIDGKAFLVLVRNDTFVHDLSNYIDSGHNKLAKLLEELKNSILKVNVKDIKFQTSQHL